MSSAEKITDHEETRGWAQARGGRPSKVKDVFKIFDERKLALLEQDKTASGAASRFFKFVER